MKSLRSTVLLIVLACQAASGQQADSSNCVIGGSVVDIVTREPLIGVNVRLLGTPNGTVTDERGRFSITGVPAGIYALRFTILGYAPAVVPDVVARDSRPADVLCALRESPLELGEVTVSPEYFSTSPDRPVSAQTQSREEIRRLPGGFEDVVRAISILPGVAQVQGGRNDLIVRGGGPSENLYVLDNIEVPNINHFGTQGASGGPLSFIDLDVVSGTTFSGGGFGVRYGDRLSSILSIDLRPGRNDRFGGTATLAATQFGVKLEGPVAGAGSVVMSLRRSYLDFIFKAAGFSFVPEYWDGLVKAEVAAGPDDDVSLLAIGAIDRVRLFNETDQKKYDNSRILFSDQDQSVAGLSWKHRFASGVGSLTLSRTEVTYDTRQNDTSLSPIFAQASAERQWTLRGDGSFRLSAETELEAGVQVRDGSITSSLALRPFWTNEGRQISADRSVASEQVRFAGYAQLSRAFGPLRLTGGLRADVSHELPRPLFLAPRGSGTYEVSSSTTVSVAVGRYGQAPSPIWVAGNPANAELSYLSATHVIAGIEHALRRDLKISLEGYLKRYSDYPASVTRPFLIMANTGAGYGGSEEGFASFGIDPLVSAGTGRSAGVELLVQKKLSDLPWYGTFSVTLGEATFTALDGVGRPGSFDQRVIVNAGGGVVFDERWEASAKFRLATGRPFTPYLPDGTQDAGSTNSERVGVNHSLDLRVDRRWSLGSMSLVTYLDVQNVYNRKPLDVPRYNERTRMVEQGDAIGILPSIGVTAEF